MRRTGSAIRSARQHRFLLGEHLEDVSRRVLVEYPEVLKALIKGRHGVYALYLREHLEYVGLTNNLMSRLRAHLKDRHQSRWDRFSVFLTANIGHIKELESLLILIAKPRGNRQSGRLVRSKNLKPTLNRSIRDRDDDKRAILLGGTVAVRHRRIKSRRGSPRGLLVGLSDRRIRIRAEWKDRLYYASILPNGTIRLAGKIYRSPSAAGRAVLKTVCNGWVLWRYRTPKGNWAQLRFLRK